MKRVYIFAGHIGCWVLLILSNFLPRYAESNESVWRLLLIDTTYSLVIVTAFYSGYLFIYQFITRTWPWPAIIGVFHILTTLTLVVLVRYGIEFGFLKPVLHFDNYAVNRHFTWGWFIQNAARYYWSWVVYGILYGFARNYVQQQRKARELISAELSLLRSQVNPHFLFNALNDIYALTLSRPVEASNAIMQLSELLRYMLYSSQSPAVPVVDEINYLKSYIELEQIGQAGRVNIRTQFTGHINGQQVAPMLLIPFVENAFKHGNLFLPDQPVTIMLDVQADRLIFHCWNSKRTGHKDGVGGIGLANICRRLDLEYAGRHKLTISENSTAFDINLSLTL
jgi:two-component system, LytTR family, sensor kinase